MKLTFQVFFQEKCCGFDGQFDWQEHNVSIPQSCCVGEACHHANDQIYEKGCKDYIIEHFHYIFAVGGGILIGITLIQVRLKFEYLLHEFP